MSTSQDLTYSLIGLACVVLLGVVAFRRHFAPHEKLKPRMVPWMIIALGCISTGFMIVVHLVNLMGFETGR